MPASCVTPTSQGRTQSLVPVYASHASPTFNSNLHGRIQAISEDVSAALGPGLLALVLGGGYGRGEGGVASGNGAERPYNDLDFVLVAKSRSSLRLDKLAPIRHAHEERLGIEVDFSRPLTPADIRRWPHTLMWFDLLNGHIVVSGPQDVLTANAPAALRAPLPAIEGTRLLLNRGAGILQALRIARGVQPNADHDFIRRNWYKCALALGDAVLIAEGCFTTAYRGREKRLASLAHGNEAVAALGLGSMYEEALRFKFWPEDPSLPRPGPEQIPALLRQWGATLLHVESRRAGKTWPTLREYAADPALREPTQHRLKFLPRNLLQNLRRHKLSLRYPRENLHRALPGLLGLTGGFAPDWDQAGAEFLETWRRFN